MENQENNNGQLQIELKEEVAQGTYANLAIITHPARSLSWIFAGDAGDAQSRSAVAHRAGARTRQTPAARARREHRQI